MRRDAPDPSAAPVRRGSRAPDMPPERRCLPEPFRPPRPLRPRRPEPCSDEGVAGTLVSVRGEASEALLEAVRAAREPFGEPEAEAREEAAALEAEAEGRGPVEAVAPEAREADEREAFEELEAAARAPLDALDADEPDPLDDAAVRVRGAEEVGGVEPRARGAEEAFDVIEAEEDASDGDAPRAPAREGAEDADEREVGRAWEEVDGTRGAAAE